MCFMCLICSWTHRWPAGPCFCLTIMNQYIHCNRNGHVFRTNKDLFRYLLPWIFHVRLKGKRCRKREKKSRKQDGRHEYVVVTKEWQTENDVGEKSLQHIQIKQQVPRTIFWGRKTRSFFWTIIRVLLASKALGLIRARHQPTRPNHEFRDQD